MSKVVSQLAGAGSRKAGLVMNAPALWAQVLAGVSVTPAKAIVRAANRRVIRISFAP
jgi:hypothetical protein